MLVKYLQDLTVVIRIKKIACGHNFMSFAPPAMTLPWEQGVKNLCSDLKACLVETHKCAILY